MKKINLEITKDKSIVLVGLNGSGKTTLSKVLMGFYEEYEGEFYVNGVNFKRINKESYYRRVSAVFQDFVKYESTIRENISFGDVEKN
nr:ATP-binding cassette domain-containing protein [Ohessyouella blattaphilus]